MRGSGLLARSRLVLSLKLIHATNEGLGVGLSSPFLNTKSALISEHQKCPNFLGEKFDCIHLWVRSLISLNAILRISKSKKFREFFQQSFYFVCCT